LTLVQSKKKQPDAPKRATLRCVHFAPNLVTDSPPVKHHPHPSLDFIRIGDFNVPTEVPVHHIFGRIKADLNKVSDFHHDLVLSECSSPIADVQISYSALAKVARSCAKCLGSRHSAR